jgi:hypothetical protein
MNFVEPDLAIKPIYLTHLPNESIRLYEGTFDLQHVNINIQVNGVIELVWLRSPFIKFSIIDKNPKDTAKIESETVLLKIPYCLSPVTIRMLSFRRINDHLGFRVECYGRIEEPLCLGQEEGISFILTHLSNFHDTSGNAIYMDTEHKSTTWKGRFLLISDGWKVTVDKVECNMELYSSLKNLGGYGITHVVKIEKEDGRDFNISDISKLREDLFYFFSFARGFWTDSCLEVGFNKEGTKVWESWFPPRSDKWQSVSSWLDRLRPDSLSTFWPKFRRQLNDEIWGESLKRAIRWYISANQKAGEIEGSIILTQTAHELLSWTKFVSERKLSEEGFRKLPASDKLRLILIEAKIPLEIPPSLMSISQTLKAENWIDGPNAIVEIRNNLVHPSPKNLKKLGRLGSNEIEDAHLLTVWYLELLLLFLLGYRGNYVNRSVYLKWIGETNSVPWTSES